MVKEDHKDTIRVVAGLTAESGNYRRQFVIWLGVGSGAGIGVLLTFAEKFAEPVVMLRALLPSIVGFAFGISSATASVLLAALRDSAGAGHHASAHNRDELARAIRSTPEVFAAPKRLADDMNVERNGMIARHDKHHAEAEKEWTRRIWWGRLYIAAVVCSIGGFLGGIVYPIGLIAIDSRSLHQPTSSEIAPPKQVVASPPNRHLSISPQPKAF